MKRFTAFLLLITLFSAMLAFPVNASENSNQPSIAPPANDALLSCLQTIADMADAERTVSAVKELRDYAGNVYYVCELEPTGYVISDASYGTIIEYSPSAPSPYLGAEGSLIYLGPTYCYARLNNGMLQNLFSGDVFSSSDDEFTSSAYEISEQIHATQAEYASTATETSTFETSSPAVLLGSSWSPDANSSTVTYHYISGGSKLKKLTQRAQIGYYDLPGDDENTRKGVCGYVAAGLLLFWVDECLQVENAILVIGFNQQNTRYRLMCLLWDIGHGILGA